MLRSIGLRSQLAIGLRFGKTRSQAQFAADIPAEFQIIGKNEICETVAVAFKLFAFLGVIEGNTDVLGFDKAKRNIFAGDDVARRATLDALRFVGGNDAGLECFEQVFQRGAVGMLGGIACFAGLLYQPR